MVAVRFRSMNLVRSRSDVLVDVVLFALLVRASLWALRGRDVRTGLDLFGGTYRTFDLTSVAVAVAQCVPLLWRRTHPGVALLAIAVCSIGGRIVLDFDEDTEYEALKKADRRKRLDRIEGARDPGSGV